MNRRVRRNKEQLEAWVRREKEASLQRSRQATERAIETARLIARMQEAEAKLETANSAPPTEAAS